MNLEVQGVSTFFDAPLRHTLLSFTRLELILVEINILFSFVTYSIYLKGANENILLFAVTYHVNNFYIQGHNIVENMKNTSISLEVDTIVFKP